jgi:hypothetical protein
MYLKALKEEFGRILDNVEYIVLRMWFYNFKKQHDCLLDRLYYVFRPPQHDIIKFFVKTGRDWDLEPAEEQWLWELLTMGISPAWQIGGGPVKRCWSTVRWFGFLSYSRRGEFGWRIKKIKKEWDKCPYCGANLDGWVRVSAEELEELLLDRPPPLR